MKKVAIISTIFLLGSLLFLSPKIIEKVEIKKIELSNQQTLTEILEAKGKESDDSLPKSYYLNVPLSARLHCKQRKTGNFMKKAARKRPYCKPISMKQEKH